MARRHWATSNYGENALQTIKCEAIVLFPLTIHDFFSAMFVLVSKALAYTTSKMFFVKNYVLILALIW